MEEIEIRLLREGDIPQINALYEKAYKIERSYEKFSWEFLGGPAGPSIYVVAVDANANRIVGTQCAIPLYVTNASGERILTAKSEDTLVDAAFRGKSIFEKMYALLFDECRKVGIVAIWGFTYAIKPFVKLGFDIPFHCNFGLIAFDVIGAYKYFNDLREKRSVTDRVKIAALVTFSRLVNLFRFGSGTAVSNEVQGSLEGKTSLQAGDFGLQLDQKFMGWRLRDNPYPNNHLYYSSGNSCIVCSQTESVSYIMHMASPTKPLLEAAIRDLSKKTRVLRFWGFTHNKTGQDEIELLRRSGFIFTGQGISFVWKKLDEKGSLNVNDFVLSRMASQGT